MAETATSSEERRTLSATGPPPNRPVGETAQNVLKVITYRI
jgi:hypothetical protein